MFQFGSALDYGHQTSRTYSNGNDWSLWYIVGGIAVLLLLSKTLEVFGERAKQIHRVKSEYREKSERIQNEYMRKFDELESDRHALETIFREKSSGFPWLATAYADYFKLKELKLADELQNKTHPAPKAAETIRESSRRRMVAERLWRLLRYRLEYYESLFPWLEDLVGEDLDETIRQVLDPDPEPVSEEEETDPVSKLLTRAEYQNLSPIVRNQLALDRYRAGRKTKWQIGRDYERFVGYTFDRAGWEVEYHGIVEGLNDLGRDIIAKKHDRTVIVQCKCWSADKQIHEKHIFQLHGTVLAYKLDTGEDGVTGLLATSTRLSDRAKQFAKSLGIDIQENLRLEEYPIIKCNVSHRDGEKIYHLPFDQQYDRTKIDAGRGERYVSTVKEAEELGFRRAWRWRGLENDSEQGPFPAS